MLKLDILFINHSSQDTIYQELAHKYCAIEPPTWSLLLAQSCRSKGFSVAILDCDAEQLSYDEAIERIKYINPRLCCFIVYGTNPNSGTTNMEGAINLAQLLRKNINNPIIFIGSHASALPYEVLTYPFVDFVSINEGVYTLHELLQTNFKEDLDKVSGLGYKDINSIKKINEGKLVLQDKMDFDLPGYAFDLLPFKNKPLDLYRSHLWHSGYNENNRTPFMAIYTSLGCNFSCPYCMINLINRTKTETNITAADSHFMRYWSADFMIKEIDKLIDIGVETLRFSDEMMYLNRKHYEPLLTKIVERGYGKKLKTWAYARIDTIKQKFLDLFRDSGVIYLALGIEAANQNIRKEVSKGTFEEIDIKDIVKKVQNSGINVIANYIFGLPNDTHKTMQQTLDLSLELCTEAWNGYPAQALPGSLLYLEAKKNGWQLPETFSGYSFLSEDCLPVRTKNLTSAEVLKFRDNAFQIYHNYQPYLNLVKQKFGQIAIDNIKQLTEIKLKRKILI